MAKLRASHRLAGVLALLIGLSATAAGGPLDPEQALRTSLDAIGRSVGDYRFVNQDGQPLALTELRGRPLVISYIYTSCAFVCPTLTSRLAEIAEIARDTLGAESFSILTVGLDTPTDTPEQMRVYALERGITMPGWYFVSGDQATVDALARDIGFSYAPVAGAFDRRR
jgi:protein SCO1/2